MRFVFAGQDGVGDGDLEVQSDARDARSGFVGDEFKVIGFAADDAAERNQCIKVVLLGHDLQHGGNFQRAGNRDMRDAPGGDAQRIKLGQAGSGERVGDGLVEARLDDADGQAGAIHQPVLLAQLSFVGAEHGKFSC